MLMVRDPSWVPPSGEYKYTIPELKLEVTSPNFLVLVDLVEHRLRAANFEVPDRRELMARISEAICPQLPRGWCSDPSMGRLRLARDVLEKGTKLIHAHAMAAWNKEGSGIIVPQEEAERRADICLKCDEHDDTSCTTCNGMTAFIRSIFKFFDASLKRKIQTSQDLGLGGCGVCKCSTAAKVHYNLEHLDKAGALGDNYPETCWIAQWKKNKTSKM